MFQNLLNLNLNLWLRTSATLYRRTIYSWRSTDKHPPTVTPERWAAWTDAWQQQDWQDRAAKNKANRNCEPAGVGTGTSKHIAGAKTYSAHGQDLRARHGRDPTSWELHVHTHRHEDGSFVDTRSRLVHEDMERSMAESVTPAGDGSEPAVPRPQSVNTMFKLVVGGRRRGGCMGVGPWPAPCIPMKWLRVDVVGHRVSDAGFRGGERHAKRSHEHTRGACQTPSCRHVTGSYAAHIRPHAVWTGQFA
ncbi:uncharacterized protein [Primulina eburnea]|uniref:uncharacterized protein n=1 Tax=Primulina eburnea TaxID=1245227 RepID=UPI003C6CB0B0